MSKLCVVNYSSLAVLDPEIRKLRAASLKKHPQIHCFFSYTMKPDVSELSSTIDYIFDLARASF